MSVDWSDDAIDAIERIRRRIEAWAGTAAADRWVDRVSESAERADFMPFATREVPEYRIRTLREVLDGDYRVINRVVPGGIEVVTVFHGSMQLEEPD